MSGRRIAASARALLATAVCVLALVAGGGVAVAASGSFQMHWQPESMFIGDVGATQKTVVRDVRTLNYANGAWTGSIGYTDVLGIFDGNGNTSQVGVLDLALRGTPVGGGSGIEGTFAGTATLYTHMAGSLDDAASAKQASQPTGSKITYDVSGKWAASVTGSDVNGELVFVSAVPRPGAKLPPHDVEWFRAGSGNDTSTATDALTLRVTGPVPAATGTTTSSVSASATNGSAGFLTYLRAGLAGGPAPASPQYVEASLAAAARALADEAPAGATPLPANSVAIDRDISGAVLDAQNVAEKLAARAATAAPAQLPALAAFALARRAAGRLTPPGLRGAVLGAQLRRELASALASSSAAGASDLATDVAAIAAPDLAAAAPSLADYLAAARAVEASGSFDGTGRGASAVLRAAAGASARIGSLTLPLASSAAGPVLAAADDGRAPADDVRVIGFARAPGLDASGTPDGAQLPNLVLVRSGVALFRGAAARGAASVQLYTLPYAPPTGAGSGVLARDWLGYRRAADGATYWLASSAATGAPSYALTDVSLLGWGWRTYRAALADAARAGRWLELYPYTPATPPARP